jgi:hypothetical protein
VNVIKTPHIAVWYLAPLGLYFRLGGNERVTSAFNI